jgi:CheY-like chemotaxis protein
VSDPLRVLVVDDETALAKVVAGYLTREGFVVDLAHDGPDAVAVARANPPDLVVLDVMLPGFDGIEVCRRLRTFTDAYIIMLTARDEEIDKIVGLSSVPMTTWSSPSRRVSSWLGSVRCCGARVPSPDPSPITPRRTRRR